MARSEIGIIGGGVLGMALALRLREQGCRVTIVEGAAAPGGLASPQSIGGFTWDRFYHVILMSDSNLRALLDDMGLSESLRWGTTRTGFYTDGRLYSLSTSIEFLTFPPLSLIDKVRLALTILYASRIRDWKRLESIPVTDWLRRLSGERTFQRIWLPLLKSKLGENYSRASASFIWAIIARMYAARRSGLKREMFGYVDGGYEVITRRLREHLESKGIELMTGRPAVSVFDSGEGAEVRFADGGQRSFDNVVLTVPCARIAAMCPQLGEGERRKLTEVVYQGIACASVLLKKPLAGYYVTNITESWVPFTAVIEMTALVDRTRFGGHSLIYLPRYLTQDDPFWSRTDAEIETEFIAALERMYPDFRREDILAFQVARAREVLALSTLDYSSTLLPPVRTSLPNVFIVNSAQIANGTLNVNETIGVANAGAIELARHLRPASSAPLAASRAS
ncbi:MAG: NAD(P)/FAD-dependent oxidoreductase [Gemmatimonadaceae bacterium]